MKRILVVCYNREQMKNVLELYKVTNKNDISFLKEFKQSSSIEFFDGRCKVDFEIIDCMTIDKFRGKKYNKVINLTKMNTDFLKIQLQK